MKVENNKVDAEKKVKKLHLYVKTMKLKDRRDSRHSFAVIFFHQTVGKETNHPSFYRGLLPSGIQNLYGIYVHK